MTEVQLVPTPFRGRAARKRRIAGVSATTLRSGGAERVMMTLLANGWAARGDEVTLVSLDEEPPFYPLHPAVRASPSGSTARRVVVSQRVHPGILHPRGWAVAADRFVEQTGLAVGARRVRAMLGLEAILPPWDDAFGRVGA